MNQIIYQKEKVMISKKPKTKTLKFQIAVTNQTKKTNYLSLLYLAIILLLSFLIFFLFSRYQTAQKEKYSEVLRGQYQVSTLYATPPMDNPKNNSSFIIGMLQIDKIGLNYPILSETSSELLSLSPCRFAGPMPNEIRKPLYCRSQLCR